MSEQADKRVEELLRVNAELAAEIRSLAAGRREAPRSGEVPSGRAVPRVIAERDKVTAERDDLATRLEETTVALEHTRADRDGLERQNREMDAEIAHLRSGFSGFLRRLRTKLLNR